MVHGGLQSRVQIRPLLSHNDVLCHQSLPHRHCAELTAQGYHLGGLLHCALVVQLKDQLADQRQSQRGQLAEEETHGLRSQSQNQLERIANP